MAEPTDWLTRLQFVLAVQLAKQDDGIHQKEVPHVRAARFSEALRNSAVWAVLETVGQVEPITVLRTTRKVELEAFRVVAVLADTWKLDQSELQSLVALASAEELSALRGISLSALADPTRDLVTALLEIFGALNVLLPIPEVADEWVRRPNQGKLFKGCSALEFMVIGGAESMHAVRGYLFAQLVGP